MILLPQSSRQFLVGKGIPRGRIPLSNMALPSVQQRQVSHPDLLRRPPISGATGRENGASASRTSCPAAAAFRDARNACGPLASAAAIAGDGGARKPCPDGGSPVLERPAPLTPTCSSSPKRTKIAGNERGLGDCPINRQSGWFR